MSNYTIKQKRRETKTLPVPTSVLLDS